MVRVSIFGELKQLKMILTPINSNYFKKENKMKHWLQSLSENGFDVFIVVYLAVLFIAYHYLLRWFLTAKFNRLEKKLGDK